MSGKYESELQRFSYVWEENRLNSFKIWPFTKTSKCNKQKLAEAGFFWTGTRSNPDSAQCFLCNKQLDGWEESDDPWEEHTKHSKNCFFVNIGKKQENLTLAEFLDTFYTMVKNLTNINAAKQMKALTAAYEEACNNLENEVNF